MSNHDDTLKALVERIRRRSPVYLDLLTSETDAEFEKAFEPILGSAVARLESNSRNFESLDENGITAALALAITIPGLDVTQETNSNGHVDITIQTENTHPIRKKLGEAKIYNGKAYHISGLEQLIGRYSTGREGRGLLIVYFKCPNIANHVTRLRGDLDIELPMKQQGACRDHCIRWSFLSGHLHSSGELLEVWHIGCNLYVS